VSNYFLGVDGGQSSTTAIIGDETGRVVGYGRGGPCNHVSGPEAKARFVGAIGAAVKQAADQAGIERLHFASACLGFSGGAEDKAPWLDEIFTTDRRVVTHDGLIALCGATGGQPGVIVIAGTGQFAFGRNASGRSARAGGWGYIYGDEGGGFDLTRQALRAALREEEGWGPKTTLREMLLAVSGAKDANDLLHRLYTPEFSRSTVASWSHLVDDAACAGDACARDILKTAANHLAAFSLAVYRNLFPQGEPDVPIAYIGGVFKSRMLLEQFRTLIAPFIATPPQYGPAAGALLEAYREAGLHPILSNVPEHEK
jgi:N-acetylglucosamine kinase-like BadF-type ATPase